MLLTILLLACGQPSTPEASSTPAAPAAEATPAAAPAAEPAEPTRAESAVAGLVVGAAFDAGTPVPVDTLIASPEAYNGKPVVVEGTVKEVCQKKGCWHTIATSNPAVDVMVKDKEYKIFLPKDSAGHKVLVQGDFAVGEIPEDEARHYAEDAGRDPSTIVGPQKRYMLDVAGVKFL